VDGGIGMVTEIEGRAFAAQSLGGTEPAQVTEGETTIIGLVIVGGHDQDQDHHHWALHDGGRKMIVGGEGHAHEVEKEGTAIKGGKSRRHDVVNINSWIPMKRM
jgi:hypothetical protein